VVIARGVGFLVAIVTIFVAICIIMCARVLISHMIESVGVSGVLAMIGLTSWLAIKLRGASMKVTYTLLTKSCI
jgi:hypothetical protein